MNRNHGSKSPAGVTWRRRGGLLVTLFAVSALAAPVASADPVETLSSSATTTVVVTDAKSVRTPIIVMSRGSSWL